MCELIGFAGRMALRGESARGPDADRHVKLLSQFAVEGSLSGAYSQSGVRDAPAAWRGTELLKQRWLAAARIPCGDLTLYSGNGGAGKTETAVQLLVAVTAGLGDPIAGRLLIPRHRALEQT